MKSPVFLFCLIALSMPFGANAQYSARQLTRKIVPQPQQQPARPSQPAPQTIAPAPGQPATAPQPESDRVKANREEAARKAVEFQKKRAEEGSPQAQYDLGVRYLKGDGVEKNFILGREWLQKSAKNGSIHAQRKLDELPKPIEAATVTAPGAIATPGALATPGAIPAPATAALAPNAPKEKQPAAPPAPVRN